MKLFFVVIIYIFLNHCSFDDKTGIWKSNNNISKKEKNLFEEFKTLSGREEYFEQEIVIKKNYTINLPKKNISKNWNDIYYGQTNNTENFSYILDKNSLSISKKLSRYNLNKYILYNDKYFILNDQRGNIITFSRSQNKVLNKYNFYNKKFKKFNKKLNLVISKNIIYVTDNIGFVYAYDYKKNNIIWAKNTKTPFRSNLKIKNNKLIAADENNNIYFFDKENGDILKLIPTEETLIKNNFVNNFSLSEDTIFFLNTYGSLFAIEDNSNEIKWVRNLNQSSDLEQINLFKGNPIVNNEKFIIVTSHDSTYIIDANNGSILHKYNVISQIKPLMIDGNLFLISKNNLLICINILSGEIIYSYKINQKIADYLKIKKQNILVDEIFLANNNILILLKNSFVVEFEIKGNLKKIFRLPKKVNSNLIFVENSIIFLNNRKKLVVLN